MTPVDQTIVCPERGDCMRAVVASLFDLELDQVPHFRLFDTKENQGNEYRSWFYVFEKFIYCMGYEYRNYWRFRKGEIKDKLTGANSIDGYFYAAVNSRVFETGRHAVVMDLNGIVIHDPSPTKKWQGVNAIESGELCGWYCFKKR